VLFDRRLFENLSLVELLDYGSPKQESISCPSATTADSSSGPSASTRTVDPHGAASIITWMIDLALARHPFRHTNTSLRNLHAAFVNWTEGRACSPNLLLILNWREIIGML
jgi:hypothetical protein